MVVLQLTIKVRVRRLLGGKAVMVANSGLRKIEVKHNVEQLEIIAVRL